jgi:hypothetical protein
MSPKPFIQGGMKMVMNNSKIDVVNKPGIMLPPGYERHEDNKPKTNTLDLDGLLHKIEEANCLPVGSISDQINLLKTDEERIEEEEMQSLFEKFEHAKSDSLGWVQKDEVEIAKRKIKQSLGFDPPPMAGWYMAIVIHEERYARTKDGKKTQIVHASIDEEKYRNCVGLVVSQGNECYLGPRFEEHWFRQFLRIFFNRWMKPCRKKPWCRVGDYVVFPRHEGELMNYRGMPMMMLPDVKIYTPIEQPEYVTRF